MSVDQQGFPVLFDAAGKSPGATIDPFGGALTAMLDIATDAVFTIDDGGTIHWANSSASRMFGWPREELLGRNINMVIPPPHHDRHDEYLADFSPGRRLTHVLGANQWLEAVRKDGSFLPVEIGICPFEHEGRQYFTGFVRDISERRATQDRLRYLATHDELTGLPNLRLLSQIIGGALARGRPFVFSLKLGGLQRVGDRHGRLAAEHLLREAVARLRLALAENVALARQGDDELAMMLPPPAAGEEQPAAASDLARLALAVAAEPIAWKSIILRLSPAIGYAEASDSLHSPELLLRAAHAACGLAQRETAPEPQVRFSPEVGAKLLREAMMEDQLRSTLADGRLTLALQPKVQARGGRVIGAEALVRWTDEVLGVVPPAEFIPIAERTGLVGDLGSWMLRRGLRELAAWQARGFDLTLAVNMSALDLRQPELTDGIARAIAEAGCDPAGLIIELTESALADDPEAATAQLRRLKALGLSLSLDDFGTGYSSLSYLRHFPVDSLKIDRSFVIDLPDNAGAVAIARAIVALAQALGLETIAEGVETAAQAQCLADLGVDILQGYLYGQPMSPTDFIDLVG